ncbi:MAG: metallophosphatase family protein [Thermomicrobiales bacterium]|nr:metallophosphatase family protein [Thermomicrobiales bacterium]
MRVGLISDVYGNRVALETVLAALARDAPDRIVCLGDCAVMGPDPAGSLDLLETLGCPVILGNADVELFTDPARVVEIEERPLMRDLILWTQRQLEERQLAFARTFVPTIELDLGSGVRLLCFHGSPRSNMEIIDRSTSPEDLAEAIEGSTATLLAGGHTHTQLMRRFGEQWLINPGSVGMTFCRTRIDRPNSAPPWAEYAIVTVEHGAIDVSLRAVPLDLARVRAQAPADMPFRDEWLMDWADPIG